VGNVTIKSKDEMKVLGIIIDKKLRWKAHLNKLISKTRLFNFAIRYLKKHLTIGDMKKILNAHLKELWISGLVS